MPVFRHAQFRGFTIVYGSIVIFAMIGLISLAVDWGRAQTGKRQLQDAVDAAARYAVTGVSDGTAVAKAQAAASENSVDGTTLSLLSSDIELGTWDSVARTFTVSSTNRNAVRITGRRSAARGTAVPLAFGRIIGRDSVDLSASAVAVQNTLSASPNVVGLSSVTLTGSGKIQRTPGEGGTVTVASNGTYSLTWGQQIAGDVLYRNTPPSTPNGANCITGTQTAMSSDIAYATPTTPGGTTYVGAANYSGGTYSVPAGNYSATSVTIGGGAVFNAAGNVNIYCSGPVDIGNGATINTNSGAYKFTIYQTAASTVNINVGTLYMRIVAPLSNVSINGSTVLYGSVVSKNLTVANIISYTSLLPCPVTPTGGGLGGGGIVTVK